MRQLQGNRRSKKKSPTPQFSPEFLAATKPLKLRPYFIEKAGKFLRVTVRGIWTMPLICFNFQRDLNWSGSWIRLLSPFQLKYSILFM